MSDCYPWALDRHAPLHGVINGGTLRRTVQRFACFLAVGLAGLAADAGLMTLLHAAGLPLRSSRAASMAVAFTLTWLLNRSITFASAGSSPQAGLARYAATVLVAQGASYGVFCALVAALPELPALAALLAGAVLAAFLSFAGCSLIVFRAPNSCQSGPGIPPCAPSSLGE